MDEQVQATRKRDHIDLAIQAQTLGDCRDQRFDYEPLLDAHPTTGLTPFTFLDKTMQAPIWISSMTGGTEKAALINQRLATAAGAFGLGMGLGSCRHLLQSDSYLADFQLRKFLGNSVPFYANLGIAQVEQLCLAGKVQDIIRLVERLEADGLIIHINPLQEWLQLEGDRLQQSPLSTLKMLLPQLSFPLIVKEVGQGMGPESLEALLRLPLAAIEFAGFGGTNFSQVELLRAPLSSSSSPSSHSTSTVIRKQALEKLIYVGHTAEEMVGHTRQILQRLGEEAQCRQFIISGGVNSFLDGHYLINKLAYPCIYGHGSLLLKYAQSSVDDLMEFIRYQIEGLTIARNFLRIRIK